MSLINHTAPDDKIPSKNQEYDVDTINISCVGDHTTKPKKKPPHVEKHIGQDSIPEINVPIVLKSEMDQFSADAKKFRSPWNMDPYTMMFMSP